jgi:N-acetylneuraminic acid mutarotase
MKSILMSSRKTWIPSKLGAPQRINSLPVALSNFAAALANGKIHVYGGAQGNTTYNSQYRYYDIASKAWGVGGSPGVFTWGGGAFAGGYFWAGAGHNGNYNSKFYRFTPLTTTYVGRAALPDAPRIQARLAVRDDSVIHELGGFIGSTSKTSNLHYSYDIAANAWTKRANLPYSCNGHTVGTYKGKIYLGGGYSDDVGGNRGVFYRYDPATDLWSAMPTMPTACSWVGGCIVKNLFVIGAAIEGTIKLHLFNFETNEWSTMETGISQRFCTEFVPDENGIWILGGCSVAPGAANFEAAARYNDMYYLPLS